MMLAPSRPVLERTDQFRSGRQRGDGTGPFKEWHHFVVHGDDCRILVNFSLNTEEWRTDGRPSARVIVLVHHDEWAGFVSGIAPDEVDIARSGVDARFGASRLSFDGGAYQLDLHLPEHGLQGRIRLEPGTLPFVKNNQPLGSSGRMSWLFVPRLTADGWMRIGDIRFSMRRARAYHDHNWGRFRWGEDFGWQWGSTMPTRGSSPWTIVFARMTDSAHTQARSQGLYVWRDDEPAVMFRDVDVEVRTEGLLRSAPRVVVPGAMRLLRPGSASDIPAEHHISARRGRDALDVRFRPGDYGRIVIPSETDPEGLVVLNEVSGEVSAWGRVGGETIGEVGTGVFEYLWS